jgi:REP element-mobilizing transposase RayT
LPRRAPIDPEGTYHIGSRGSYGRVLYDSVAEHECFLRMYRRVSRKYDWTTYAWALMRNHHHFVVTLSDGGLSEGLRELHGGYSRWLHARYGQTGQGHAVRHAFFARSIVDDADLIGTCAYVDSNPSVHRLSSEPAPGDWGGYAATLDYEHPRSFHSPALLLEVIDPRPSIARARYREAVAESHVRRRLVPSPNDVFGVIQSQP